MPERRPRTRELHEMVRGETQWYCIARNPRCSHAVPLADMAGMLAHVTGNQPDLTHLPPLADIVGNHYQDEEVA